MAFEREVKSVSEQKGDCGEAIVLSLLCSQYHYVNSLCGRNLYDFSYKDSRGRLRFADAKARMLPLYQGKLHDCFSFNAEKLNTYMDFAAERNCPFELWVVDARDGKVYVGELSRLRKDRCIHGVTFPTCRLDPSGEHMVDIHCEQFDRVFTIEPNNPHLVRLRELYGLQPPDAKATPTKMSDLLQIAVLFLVSAEYGEDFAISLDAEDALREIEAEFGTAATIYGLAEEQYYFSYYAEQFLNGKDNKIAEFIRENAIDCSLNEEFRLDWNDMLSNSDYYSDTYTALMLCAHMDFPTIAEAADHFRKKLSTTPMYHVWKLRQLCSEIFKADSVWFIRSAQTLREQINAAFSDRRDNLHLTSWAGLTPNNLPPVIELKNTVKVVKTIEMPNGQKLDVVSCGGKLFVFAVQLSMCIGAHSGKAMRSNFMDAARAATQIYSIRKPTKCVYRRAILLDDVHKVARKYNFDFAIKKEQYEQSAAFLKWWTTQKATFKINLAAAI